MIAKYLSKLNYEVEILDAEAENFTHEQTAEIISNKTQNLQSLLFMANNHQLQHSVCLLVQKLVKLIQITQGDIKTLVMGTHASALPRRTLEEEPYDFVCQGEGPITISNLIDKIKNHKDDYSKIPGLWYRDKDNEVRSNIKSKNV